MPKRKRQDTVDAVDAATVIAEEKKAQQGRRLQHGRQKCERLCLPQQVKDMFRSWGEDDYMEYADNSRVAQKSDPDQVAWYNYVRDHGCCGSCDIELTVDGEVWLLGCNYGH